MDSKKYIIVLDWVYNCIWVFGKIFMLQRKAVMSSVPWRKQLNIYYMNIILMQNFFLCINMYMY